MATVRTSRLTETITYWAPASNDGFGGVGYAAPVPRLARWEDKAELFRDAQGREVTSSAVVFVDADVENAGHLYRGVSASASPITGSKEIRAVGKIDNLTGFKRVLQVWL